MFVVFFFQAEDGIRDIGVTGVQTCALPISGRVTVPAGPAGVDGGEGAVGEGAAFEIEGQDGGVVGLSCSEKRIYLRVDALHLDVEHPAQNVGEVDGVVHHRAAA